MAVHPVLGDVFGVQCRRAVRDDRDMLAKQENSMWKGEDGREKERSDRGATGDKQGQTRDQSDRRAGGDHNQPPRHPQRRPTTRPQRRPPPPTTILEPLSFSISYAQSFFPSLLGHRPRHARVQLRVPSPESGVRMHLLTAL